MAKFLLVFDSVGVESIMCVNRTVLFLKGDESHALSAADGAVTGAIG